MSSTNKQAWGTINRKNQAIKNLLTTEFQTLFTHKCLHKGLILPITLMTNLTIKMIDLQIHKKPQF